MFDSFTAITPS